MFFVQAIRVLERVESGVHPTLVQRAVLEGFLASLRVLSQACESALQRTEDEHNDVEAAEAPRRPADSAQEPKAARRRARRQALP